MNLTRAQARRLIDILFDIDDAPDYVGKLAEELDGAQGNAGENSSDIATVEIHVRGGPMNDD